MKQEQYYRFVALLSSEDKGSSVEYALQLLHEENVSLLELYQDFLARSLNEYVCPIEDKEACIWREPARTAIVRTIVEATYPYVLAEKTRKAQLNQTVLVVCPSEEYHEVGALIVANFFELAGFNARYIGANTPKKDILSAVKVLKPDYLALSVTNYYNVVQTKQITDEVKSLFPEVKIILGGAAFSHPSSLSVVQYDYHLTSYDSIEALAKEVSQ